jgi:hypothetical protein
MCLDGKTARQKGGCKRDGLQQKEKGVPNWCSAPFSQFSQSITSACYVTSFGYVILVIAFADTLDGHNFFRFMGIEHDDALC